jgi:hypothetical protein
MAAKEVSVSADVGCCEGFRIAAHRHDSACAGAVVRKPPGKEPAGDDVQGDARYTAPGPTAPQAPFRESGFVLWHIAGFFCNAKLESVSWRTSSKPSPFNRSYRLAIVLSIPTACSQSARGNSGRSATYCESPSYTQFRKRSPAPYPAAGDQCGTLPNA